MICTGTTTLGIRGFVIVCCFVRFQMGSAAAYMRRIDTGMLKSNGTHPIFAGNTSDNSDCVYIAQSIVDTHANILQYSKLGHILC
ncbi:hypothetical protein HDV64DRAFT_250303 [Trichoderma sp. TUCIM 5745]